jgi:hydrogenase/urease accessory protein HupE
MNFDKNNSGNKSISKWIAALAVTLITLPASAHPGHGLLENGVAHQFTSPYHVLISLLIGLVLLGAARVIRQSAVSKTLCWSGGGFVALAAVLVVLRSPAW